MKLTLVAILATCVAMLATSGIVVLATAATSTPSRSTTEELSAELTSDVDTAITRQLLVVKARLNLPRGPLQ